MSLDNKTCSLDEGWGLYTDDRDDNKHPYATLVRLTMTHRQHVWRIVMAMAMGRKACLNVVLTSKCMTKVMVILEWWPN